MQNVSEKVGNFWAKTPEELFGNLDSSESGISDSEAESRLKIYGFNSLDVGEKSTPFRLLARQFSNPIILILLGATTISTFTGDTLDGIIITLIVIPSILLGFWQEYSAGIILQNLIQRVKANCEFVRDGKNKSLILEQTVPGDVVLLNTGDLIPGDGILFFVDSLEVDESALTGESFPVVKEILPSNLNSPISERRNCVFFGTHVTSGTGKMLVVKTGLETEIGKISKELEKESQKTSFEIGATSFGLLLVKYIGVLLTLVLTLNFIKSGNFSSSLLFSVALAVGLTPQLLPAIVSVTLSQGAKALAKASVLVKRLNAIEDLGSMSALCSDKTGTLTHGVVRLDKSIRIDGKNSEDVLNLAFLNAGLQRSYSNSLDQAIIQGQEVVIDKELIAELPYDFNRKRLSVLVSANPYLLITKGAVSKILEICTSVRTDRGIEPIANFQQQIKTQFEALSSEGYRVLAVSTREVSQKDIDLTAEAGMCFEGFLGFLDPLKSEVRQNIEKIRNLGIDPYLVTGDNPLIAKYIADQAGFDSTKVLTGAQIIGLTSGQLKQAVKSCHVFAEIEPLQKVAIVKALQDSGESVGLLGDGINDAPAIRESDVGMSVDTAVEVAKKSAAIVLLDKDLGVIADGVVIGRRTFVNTLKYIKVTISANFGNVLSMAIISIYLPFLPLLPAQILLLNFISDIPALAIASDSIDKDQTKTSQKWNVKEIRRFMIVFGLVSSVFDFITFGILIFGLDASVDEFRTAWFIESTLTEVIALLVLRTSMKFWQSRPSKLLFSVSLFVSIFTFLIPYLSLAKYLGMQELPLNLLGVIVVLGFFYIALNEFAKRIFFRKISSK